MKNKLIKGLFGFGLILLMTTGVYANVGYGDWVNGGGIGGALPGDAVNAVVGEVDGAIYSASITWTSMQYNYKYDEEYDIYKWVVTNKCELINAQGGAIDGGSNIASDYDNLYTDSTCSTEYEGETTDEELLSQGVYGSIYGGKIIITDNSKLGTITPSITWTSTDDYSYVHADVLVGTPVVTYDAGPGYCGPTEMNGMQYCNSLIGQNGIDTSLSDDYRFDNKYYLKLKLSGSSEGVSTRPTTGDTIGSLTISFEAN